ncbi:MAG: hypothetical protein L3J32_02970, partial [Rhizobiaceae bacterium]|nr:hypothetical protein [Rhizobiaceae bacterium]
HVTVHALLLPTHGTFGTRAVVCRVDQWEQYMGSGGCGDKFFEVLLLFYINRLIKKRNLTVIPVLVTGIHAVAPPTR